MCVRFLAGPTSAHLLKVDLNIIPTSQCNISYFPNMSRNLKSGILNDRMMCAGWAKGGKDTCSVSVLIYDQNYLS